MRRTLGLRVVLLATALLAAACSSGKGESAKPPKLDPTTTTITTSTTAEPTTTTDAPTTTTAAPTTTAAARSLAGTNAKAVLTPTGITVPVLGTQGDGLLVGTP